MSVVFQLNLCTHINKKHSRLNSRDVLHGRGVNEEESAISSRKGSAGITTSSDGTRSSAPVRFNVTDSKVRYPRRALWSDHKTYQWHTMKMQSINIEVTQTVDMDHDESRGKVEYDDYPSDGRSIHSDLVSPFYLCVLVSMLLLGTHLILQRDGPKAGGLAAETV